MITKKQLKEEIMYWDVISYIDENEKVVEYVEVTLTDRTIEVHMDVREVNIGLIANKILEDNLYN